MIQNKNFALHCCSTSKQIKTGCLDNSALATLTRQVQIRLRCIPVSPASQVPCPRYLSQVKPSLVFISKPLIIFHCESNSRIRMAWSGSQSACLEVTLFSIIIMTLYQPSLNASVYLISKCSQSINIRTIFHNYRTFWVCFLFSYWNLW